jgi:hypothetical protein
VQDRAHHPSARLGVAVRHRDGGAFVQAQDHLGALIADVVHQAVVQPAKARPGHERDPGHIERLQHARDRVARPELLVSG